MTKTKAVKAPSTQAAGAGFDVAALTKALKQGVAKSTGTVTPQLLQALKDSGVMDALVKEATAHLQNRGGLLAGDVDKLQEAFDQVSGSSHQLDADITLWDGDHDDHRAAQEIIWDLPENGPINAKVYGGFPNLHISAVGPEEELKDLMKKLERFVKMDPRPSISIEALEDE